MTILIKSRIIHTRTLFWTSVQIQSLSFEITFNAREGTMRINKLLLTAILVVGCGGSDKSPTGVNPPSPPLPVVEKITFTQKDATLAPSAVNLVAVANSSITGPITDGSKYFWTARREGTTTIMQVGSGMVQSITLPITPGNYWAVVTVTGATVVARDSVLFVVPPPAIVLTADWKKAFNQLGKTIDLGPRVHVTPVGTSVSWTSSDMAKATVDSKGVVTGRSFGYADITASAGTVSQKVQVFFAPRVTSFKDATSGCPSPAEVSFIDALIKMNFDGDTTTVVCTPSLTGTVSMTALKAVTYRVLVAAAGLAPADLPGLDSLPWSPKSTSFFQWLMFESGGFTEIRATTQTINKITAGAEMWPGGVMVWVPNYARVMGQLLLGIIAHEVRHIQTGVHPCVVVHPSGVVAQLDNKLSDMGAYAVEYYLLDVLSKSSVSTSAEQISLAGNAKVLLNNGYFQNCKP